MHRSLDVLHLFPSPGSAGRRLASLPRVLRGEFPCFGGTIKALRLPAARPAALRCLRLAVPQRPLVRFAPQRTSAPPRPGVGNPVAPAGISAEETTGSPKFLGNRLSVCTCSTPTPAGPLTPDRYGAAAWPLVIERQRLPRKVFRRSIAWLSDSLFTLRSAGCPAPRKTRFRPLVRRYRTGFPPARFQ